MVTDERFFAFMKYLLHYVADVETRLRAVEIVLKENYHEEFRNRVAAVVAKIEEVPEVRAYRESINTLDLGEMLDAFEKYRGPIQ